MRQLLSSGIITIDYVKSKDNVSNPLTKDLTREDLKNHRREWDYGREQVIVAVTLPKRLEMQRSKFKEIKQSH